VVILHFVQAVFDVLLFRAQPAGLNRRDPPHIPQVLDFEALAVQSLLNFAHRELCAQSVRWRFVIMAEEFLMRLVRRYVMQTVGRRSVIVVDESRRGVRITSVRWHLGERAQTGRRQCGEEQRFLQLHGNLRRIGLRYSEKSPASSRA
jgi:hypothetical protein